MASCKHNLQLRREIMGDPPLYRSAPLHRYIRLYTLDCTHTRAVMSIKTSVLAPTQAIKSKTCIYMYRSPKSTYILQCQKRRSRYKTFKYGYIRYGRRQVKHYAYGIWLLSKPLLYCMEVYQLTIRIENLLFMLDHIYLSW